MAMTMPRPGPQHQNLARMAGRWAGPEQLLPSPWSPEPQHRHGFFDTRMLEGMFAVSDYEQRDGDQVVFRGHGVYAHDPAADEYVMYWFDSMGGAGGVARGRMDGDVLTFVNSSPRGQHRYRYTFGAGEMKFEMAMSSDGRQWHELMVGRYRPQ